PIRIKSRTKVASPLPLPPVLRGERVGVRGDGVPGEADIVTARILTPLTPTLSPRSTGGRGSGEATPILSLMRRWLGSAQPTQRGLPWGTLSTCQSGHVGNVPHVRVPLLGQIA